MYGMAQINGANYRLHAGGHAIQVAQELTRFEGEENMGSSAFESVSGKVDTEFPPFHSQVNQPIELACAWVQEAIREKVREPRAIVLTTANAQGEMSSRVMAILDFSGSGILFATHSCSRKIQDINSNSHACAHFYWKELGRQLSVSGKVIKLPHATARTVWENGRFRCTRCRLFLTKANRCWIAMSCVDRQKPLKRLAHCPALNVSPSTSWFRRRWSFGPPVRIAYTGVCEPNITGTNGAALGYNRNNGKR